MRKISKNIAKIAGLYVLTGLLAAFTSCEPEVIGEVDPPKRVLGVQLYLGQTGEAFELYERADLLDSISFSTYATLFVPSDTAFVRFYENNTFYDEDNVRRTYNQEFARYFTVAGPSFPELADGQTLTTLTGESISISADGSTVTGIRGDQVNVIETIDNLDNGIIYVLDGVLLSNTLPE